MKADHAGRDRPERSLWRYLAYEVGRVICLTVFTAAFRLRRTYHGRTPRRGPMILVSNHQSFLDPPLIGALATNRQLRYVARAGLFRDARFSRFIRFFGAIPIPEDGRAESASMRAILAALSHGDAVLLFPEGTRTSDGSVGEFKRGVGLLLKRSRCPVTPVAIAGAFEAWPRWQRTPSPGVAVHVVMGRAIDHADLLSGGVDAALNRLEREVANLHDEAERRLRGRMQDD